MLGGILAIESIINEIESLLTFGFPEQFIPPCTFQDFMDGLQESGIRSFL